MSVTPDDATRLLHAQVPLLAHAEVTVRHVDADRVVAHAPLSVNGNHHGSAFGGSLSLLGIVTGWLLAYAGQATATPSRNIVVAESRSRYLRPLHGDIVAEARWDPDQATAYRATLAKGERAAVRLRVTVAGDGGTALEQDNRFVTVPE
ncbi:YiiD C-terminal domain-containing protein [Algiphilus sp.]|uniref:YiiD C-terminal domain-containing protein n=1 Tax=Algiphilus sp. TaxID=1872431 RepID=UPI003C3B768D